MLSSGKINTIELKMSSHVLLNPCLLSFQINAINFAPRPQLVCSVLLDTAAFRSRGSRCWLLGNVILTSVVMHLKNLNLEKYKRESTE